MVVDKNSKLMTNLLIYSVKMRKIYKQEESARERALCQLTECF